MVVIKGERLAKVFFQPVKLWYKTVCIRYKFVRWMRIFLVEEQSNFGLTLKFVGFFFPIKIIFL